MRIGGPDPPAEGDLPAHPDGVFRLTRIVVTADLAACHALRRAVFIVEQGIAEPEEWDDLDAAAIHLLALEGARAVGTARLLIQGTAGRIGRICVARPARGRGVGTALVRAGIARLSAAPAVTHLHLGAQLHAIAFYEKLGFRVCGPEYDDAGIAHREMTRPV